MTVGEKAHAGEDDYGVSGRSAWLDIDWREHLRSVSIDGRRGNYVELGPSDGSPVVFVHGLGGRWANWLENIPALARDHRVLAVDLPGFGESEMPAEEITISGYGRWLERFCEAAGVDAACFVGNSMGGFVSAELAIRCPERVERLVLVSAAGLTSEHLRSDRGLALLRTAEALLAWQTAQVAKRAHTMCRRPRMRRLLLWFVARHPERLSPAIACEQVMGAGRPGFIDALDALTDYRIRDRIPEISCPTLIVWGRNDLLVPVRDAHRFHEMIDRSRLRIYEDTGHLPQLERPARFNADLRDFLAEQAEHEADRRREAAAR